MTGTLSNDGAPSAAPIPGRRPRPFTLVGVAALVVLAVAAALRFAALDLRPFHHDEGVNGFFLTNLVRQNNYNYDPANYHGPSLYYLTLPLVAVFGLETSALRATTALFGLGIVALLLRVLRLESAGFALAAAALFAVSPGAVFFARYFIHETLFVCFTLACVAAAHEWRSDASRRYHAMAVAFAMMFTTKETHFVSLGALAGATILATWMVRGETPWAFLRRAARDVSARRMALPPALLTFAAISALLYTSILKNLPGLVDAFRTLAFWVKTGRRDHLYPWWQHFQWLREADPVLLFAGAGGVVLAFALRRSFFAVLAAWWTIALFFAYSVVGYKTPWLGLNMLLPLAICAGYGLAEVGGAWAKNGGRGRAAFAAASVLALSAWSARQSYDLEFVNFDREEHAYIYAHTQRDFLRLVDAVERAADQLPKKRAASIAIFAPENWPLPWYLRDYTATAYWGEYKHDVDADIYINATSQDGAVNKKTGLAYERSGPFHLRGDVYLYVYARRPEAP